eukprot:744434-Pleurochrysis_carterae.AAC.1
MHSAKSRARLLVALPTSRASRKTGDETRRDDGNSASCRLPLFAHVELVLRCVFGCHMPSAFRTQAARAFIRIGMAYEGLGRFT